MFIHDAQSMLPMYTIRFSLTELLFCAVSIKCFHLNDIHLTNRHFIQNTDSYVYIFQLNMNFLLVQFPHKIEIPKHRAFQLNSNKIVVSKYMSYQIMWHKCGKDTIVERSASVCDAVMAHLVENGQLAWNSHILMAECKCVKLYYIVCKVEIFVFKLLNPKVCLIVFITQVHNCISCCFCKL